MEQILVIFVAVVSGVLPMLVYMTFIYWMDRYEREPWWMVGLVFLWGGLGGALFGCVINTLLIGGITSLLGGEQAEWIGPVMVAPVVEEATKIAPLFGLILLRHFDNATDGLIYGAAAGLGFAMTENIFYYYNIGSSAGLSAALFTNILIRTVFTAVVHALASASWGFWLGVGRYRRAWMRWLVFPPLGYLNAMAIHAFWNGSVTFAGLKNEEKYQFAAFAVIGLLACGMFALTQVSLFLEHRIVKKFLLEEAKGGLLPEAHALTIPYWLKRQGRAWLSPFGHVDKDRYLKAATLLAFRLHQSGYATGETKAGLLRDVEKHRQELKILLTPPKPAEPPRGWDAPSWERAGAS